MGWTDSKRKVVTFTEQTTGRSVTFLSFYKGMKSAYYSRAYMTRLFKQESLVAFYKQWGYVPKELEKYQPRFHRRSKYTYERTLMRRHRK